MEPVASKLRVSYLTFSLGITNLPDIFSTLRSFSHELIKLVFGHDTILRELVPVEFNVVLVSVGGVLERSKCTIIIVRLYQIQVVMTENIDKDIVVSTLFISPRVIVPDCANQQVMSASWDNFISDDQGFAELCRVTLFGETPKLGAIFIVESNIMLAGLKFFIWIFNFNLPNTVTELISTNTKDRLACAIVFGEGQSIANDIVHFYDVTLNW